MNATKFMNQLNEIVEKFKAEAAEYGKPTEVFDIYINNRYLSMRMEVEDENEETVVVNAEIEAWDSDGLHPEKDCLNYFITDVFY